MMKPGKNFTGFLFFTICCFSLWNLCSSKVFAQTTADFTSNITSGCSPVVVNFSDLSTINGSPLPYKSTLLGDSYNSHTWNLGNGNTSTLQNPGATYNTPGTYTVTLTVTDGSGSDTETKTAYITVFAKPTADFSGVPLSGCVPLSVNFSDASTPGSGAINQWFWDFGDGNNSNLQTPSHVYSSPGNYTVSLIVTDINGCSRTITKTNFINSFNGPVANFSAPDVSSCSVPFSVSFTNSSTGSGGLTYQWTLPGASPSSSTAQNPTVTYNTPGAFTVTLVVNDGGCTSTMVKTNFIKIIQANFNSNIQNGCAPLTVNFSDISLGSPTNWQWNFGDATTSSAQNPVHTYSSPGTYAVTLTAGDGTCTESETKTNFITVGIMPAMDFTASDTVPCTIPSAISFTDITSGAVAWQWDFGDGTSSSTQSPVHSYTDTGAFDVSLIVTAANGCKDTLEKIEYINLQQPNAIFSGDTVKGCAPLTVQFTDASISGSPVVGWNWVFGDGNTSSLQNPQNTFVDTGQYIVRLYITNEHGCIDSAAIKVWVGEKPTAGFSATPLSGCRPLEVNFTDQSSSLANMWLWQFGDGSTDTTQNPMHTYNDTGSFDVSLIVSHNGCRDTLTFTDYVTVYPPRADFSVLPGTIGCSVPFTVTIDEQAQGADTWFWDFGGGITYNVQDPPAFTYNAGGTYTIKLVVTNNASGCADSTTQTIRISNAVADFTVSGNGCQPLVVNINDSSSSPFGIRSWEWDFGDGYTVNNLQGQSGSASIPNGTNNYLTSGTYGEPIHTYMSPGNYSVKLIITDQLVCTDTIILTDAVSVSGIPIVNISSDKQTGCPPFTVQFSDLSTGTVGMAEWDWSFGDGGTDTVQNPVYTYTSGGVYKVTLIASDSNGCISGIVKNNYITVISPSAGFISNTGSCIGISQLFSDTSTAYNPIASWFWDFGDGTTDTLENPTHIYGSSGVFDVTLAITDTAGCVDTVVRPNYMTVQSVTANFGANPVSANCPPLLVQFTDSSSGGIVSWFWQFGNGNTSTLTNPQPLYNTPGKYDVTLIVTSSLGCKDTLFIPELIKIDGPNGDLSFIPDSGCPGTTVFFDTANVENAINYTWDFGDGTVVISAPPLTHKYLEVGVYHPFLTFQDLAGCSFGVEAEDSIQIVNIPVDAGPDKMICEGDSAMLQASGGIIYSWSPAATLSSNNISNPVAGPADTTKYYVLVTDADGCKNTDSVRVLVNHNLPAANFSSASVCKNETTMFLNQSTISNDTIVSWIWDFNNGEAQSADTNPSHIFASSGNFFVSLIVESDQGCVDTVINQVTVFPLPVANAGNDTVMCYGESAVLAASGGINYSWFPDPTINDTSIANPTAGPLFSTTYYVIVKDANNCVDTDSVFVAVNPLPVADAGTGSQICPGDSIQLSANGGVSYSWTPDPTLNMLNTAITFASPTDTTEYFVSVTDNNGCVNVDSVTIIVNPNFPQADFSAFAVCFNGETFFTDLSSMTGDTIVSWQWDFDDAGSASSDTNPSYIFSSSGSFLVSLTVTTDKSCTDTVVKNVTVNPLPVADAGTDTAVCIGESAFLQASGGISYSWFADPTLNNTNTASPEAIPLSTNSYVVVVRDVNNCLDTDTVVVTVNPLPPADAGADFQLCIGDSAVLNASGGDLYLWAPGSTLSSASVQNPFASPADTTKYYVSVTDSNGCVNMDSVTVTVNPNYPQADFSFTTVCRNDITSFTDQSSMTGDTIVNWEWDFDDGVPVVTDTNPSRVFSSAGNFFVLLTITTDKGCSDTAGKQVVVNPLPIADAGKDTAICIGESAPLLASGGIFYAWFSSPSLSDTTDSATTATPVSTTSYFVIVQDINQCIDTDTVVVMINPLPIAFAGNDTLLCLEQKIVLNATGGEVYLWEADSTLSQLDSANPTAIPVDTTEYFVTVTDSNGCKDMDTIQIIVNPNLPVASFAATIVCEENSTSFTDLSSTTGDIITGWLWDFGDASTDTISDPGHLYSQEGTYPVSLIISTDKNCKDTITDTVYVNEKPQAGFSVSNNCFGEITNFSNTSSIGQGDISGYSWDFGDNSASSVEEPSHNFAFADTFSVRLIIFSDSGCTDTVTKTIQVYPKPFPAFSSDPVCLKEIMQFDDLSVVDTSVSITSWNWDFGDGTAFSVDSNPAHEYSSAGTYNAKLVVATGGSASCADSIVQPVTVNPLPQMDCSAEPTATTTQSPDIQFSAASVSTYQWNFAGLDTSSLRNPVFAFTDSGLFTVSMVASNQFGCFDTCELDIYVAPFPEIDVPNAFTPNPNGPNGGDYSDNPFANDVFFPVAKFVVQFQMQIFNRWGELLFISNDLRTGWDGYYKGKLCQQDVYVWKIKATFADKSLFSGAGDVTLLR